MKRALWWISRSRLGWPGAGAVVLLALAIAAQFVLLRPLQARIDLLGVQPTKTRVVPAGTDATGERLERFHRHFREAQPVAAQLARIHQIAASHGITLARGEYHLVADGDAPLRHYEITFPVSAPYPAIRAFLAQALDELPTVALEQVTFERKRIGDAAVDAQVRLTLYFEP